MRLRLPTATVILRRRSNESRTASDWNTRRASDQGEERTAGRTRQSRVPREG